MGCAAELALLCCTLPQAARDTWWSPSAVRGKGRVQVFGEVLSPPREGQGCSWQRG